MGSTEDTTASVRLRLSPRLLLSPTLAMVDTADTVDMVDTALATAGVSMASVRPRLSPTSDMVDTVLVDTAATAMEVSTGDTMASVRLRPSPTSDMEVMEDTVLVAMADMVVTVMAMASKISPSICDHIPLNHLVFLHSCILTNK